MLPLLTFTRPATSILTAAERITLKLEDYAGELYLRVRSERPVAFVLRIDVWTGRTFGFLHGYVGYVLRS